MFTLGNASDAFLLLRAQDLGVPVTSIPLLWGVFHVSKMLANVVGGVLADRAPPPLLIGCGWTLYAAVYVGFAFAQEATQVWTLLIIYGGYYGLTEAPEKKVIADLVPAEKRGGAFGAYHCATGIAALPASVLFGLVWTAVSPRGAFLLGSGIAGVSAIGLGVWGLAIRRRRAGATL